jgi:hypothetical protein
MGKRLIIAVTAVVVIGVVAHVFSQPEVGTVEWHKDRYLRERKKLERRTILDCLERSYVKICRPRNYRFRTISGDALLRHQTALIRLGFLEERRVDVTNHLGGLLRAILTEGREIIPREREPFAQLSAPPSITIAIEGVVVIAPSQDVPVWVRLIYEADAKIPPDPRPKRSLRLTAPDRLPGAAALDDILREGPDVRRGASNSWATR